jgi:tetratricopeptide (TPR) repeat protein
MTPLTRSRVAWIAIGIAIMAAIPFLPGLQNEFVSWDDDKNFLANEAWRGLGLDQIGWMWSTFHHGHYVPLSWMTLGLDHVMWGMDARGYHLTSLILHAANAAVVFLVARRLLAMVSSAGDIAVTLGAAVSALWFAVHPLRVESVSWVTERRDVLSGLFYSLTLLLYLDFAAAKEPTRRRYFTTIAVFAMALLSKATAMTLPAVLLVLNVFPLRRLAINELTGAPARRIYREVAPFAALSASAMLLSIVALDPGEQLGFVDKVVVSAYGLAFYLWKTIVPTGLAAYYPLPRDINIVSPPFLAAYATVAALAALTWQAWKRAQGAAFAIATFVVVLLPMLGVVQNGPQIAADRYTYHAAPALALLVAALFVEAWRRSRLLASAGALVLLGVLGALTWRQTGYWRDSDALWSRVVEVSPDAAIGHNALGNILMEREQLSLALSRYELAVQYDPSLAAAHDNLGVALARLGRLSESLPHFDRAVANEDEAGKAYSNWGVALLQLGDLHSAADKFSKAVALDSLNANAHANWGAVLARLGRWSEAAERLTIAARLNPYDADVRANLERVQQELARQAPAKPPTAREP